MLCGTGCRIDQFEPLSPEWTKDLVIYEIAPRGFTSPNGPESGTFESSPGAATLLAEPGRHRHLARRLCAVDSTHFFNIWMCYASIEPDKIDPSLGTPDDFKALIEEAHSRGIKVFLDVTTHGFDEAEPPR